MKQETYWVACYALVMLLTLLITHWGSRAVTVLVENAVFPSSRTIVIDPGHGGVDGGATSCTGLAESGYNLDIALKLEDLFHLMGYPTVMTRREDISIYTKGETIAQKKISDLKERVRIVNETPNALLLSIHQNNFSDSRYSGAQVFYAPTEGSEELARKVQKGMVQYLNPGSRRDIKKSSGIYLMEHITAPGVLIECGFLSNPEEEACLRDKDYQQKLCAVIVKAVLKNISNT